MICRWKRKNETIGRIFERCSKEKARSQPASLSNQHGKACKNFGGLLIKVSTALIPGLKFLGKILGQSCLFPNKLDRIDQIFLGQVKFGLIRPRFLENKRD